MSINKLNHYAIETPVVSVFDEESLTALELAGRMARKLNEVIAAQNHLDEATAQRIKELEREITQTLATMPSTAMAACNQLIENGKFDEAINLYLGDLKGRLDNLYNNVAPGTTSYDAEIIDARLIADGTNPQNLGVSLRTLRNLYETEQDYIPGAILYGSQGVTNADAVVTEVETGLDVNGNKLLEMDLINGTIAAWAACMGTSGTPLSGKTARITVVNRGVSPAHVNVIASQEAHWGTSVKILNNGILLGVGESHSFDYSFPEGAAERFVTLRLSTGSFNTKHHLAFGVRILKNETETRKPLPIGNVTFSNVTEENFTFEATDNGQRIVKAVHNNTNAKWMYNVIAYKLGTLASLRGKGIMLDVKKSREIGYEGLSLKANAWNQYIKLTGDGVKTIALDEYCDQLKTDFNANETDDVFYILADQCQMTTAVWPELTLECSIFLAENGWNTADVLSPRGMDVVKQLTREMVVTNGGEYKPQIVCWGDSLTAQGGWTDILALWSGLEVVNKGVGGEKIDDIMFRQGAAYCVGRYSLNFNANSTMLIDNGDIRAYTSGYANKISVTPAKQGGELPVYIDGTKPGNLRYDTSDDSYRFVSASSGKIDPQTPIISRDSVYFNSPTLMIIWAGRNNGENGYNPDYMIPKLKQMLAFSKAKDYLILGTPHGNATNGNAFDEAMSGEFGQHYVSIRSYLVQFGLSETGLTATAADTAAIGSGEVPPSLFTDGVHFTEAARNAIGAMLCRHLRITGILRV